MDAQIKKGILELVILQLLSQKESYGYVLLKEISSKFEVSESGIYAILRRLCSDGYLGITKSIESQGPPRKIYYITKEGRQYLSSQKEELMHMMAVLKEWNFFED